MEDKMTSARYFFITKQTFMELGNSIKEEDQLSRDSNASRDDETTIKRKDTMPRAPLSINTQATDNAKSSKPHSAMASLRALGSLTFLGRKPRALEKSKSAMLLSSNSLNNGDSIERQSIFSAVEQKTVPFDEVSQYRKSSYGSEGHMDAFRLFSNNVLTSVLVTQVCIQYRDQSTNLRVSLNCSVIDLIATILSKIGPNETSSPTITKDPNEFLLGKRDRNHPAMQIWMDGSLHAQAYGILQGVHLSNQGYIDSSS
jgi:hypothetical protein